MRLSGLIRTGFDLDIEDLFAYFYSAIINNYFYQLLASQLENPKI